MNTEELNVLNQFELLAPPCEQLTIANELITYAKKLYNEIIEVRQRLAEIDNEKYFETKRNWPWKNIEGPTAEQKYSGSKKVSIIFSMPASVDFIIHSSSLTF